LTWWLGFRPDRAWYTVSVSDPEWPGDHAAADAGGLVVPSAPRSVALVRRYAVDACAAFGWADAADTVALLVSELATNAVLHAYAPHIHVRVLDHGPRLRVEVFDGSPVLPVPRRARASAEDGRGLALVEALATRWGVDVASDGKTTWFEIGV
jgi:anti-sigma regulatory factor (Ser/Thr protein kinase)